MHGLQEYISSGGLISYGAGFVLTAAALMAAVEFHEPRGKLAL
jgi:hypothetical protein